MITDTVTALHRLKSAIKQHNEGKKKQSTIEKFLRQGKGHEGEDQETGGTWPKGLKY